MSSPGRRACVLRWLFVATLFVPNLRRLPKPGGNNREGLLNSDLQGRRELDFTVVGNRDADFV